MMSVTNKAGPAFRKRAEMVKRLRPDLLHREARLAAVSLATQCQPFGTSTEAQRMGQTAVVHDIRRIYALPSDAFPGFTDKKAAGAFWYFISNSFWDRAAAIMRKFCPPFANLDIRPFDGGQAHRSNRNSRGRISKTARPAFIVQDEDPLKTYINQEFKKVGWAKAGWASCAKALGGARGLPGWVTRHKAPGTVEERNTNGHSEITLVNQVNYSSELLTDSQRRNAIGIAIDRLRKALLIEERHAAKAAGF